MFAKMTIMKPALVSASRRLIKNNTVKKTNPFMHQRTVSEKLNLGSYLSVCVNVGQLKRALDTLVKHSCSKSVSHIVDVQHYNIVLKAWAKTCSYDQLIRTRMHMIEAGIEPNAETFACLLLGFSRSNQTRKYSLSKLLKEMEDRNIDSRKILQATYFNHSERDQIVRFLKKSDPNYTETFFQVTGVYDCKILKDFDKNEIVPYEFYGGKLPNLLKCADYQRKVENMPSVYIESVAKPKVKEKKIERHTRLWYRHYDMWRETLDKALTENLAAIKEQFEATNSSGKIHIYPYLCSVDKNVLINLMLNEIENNAMYSSFSMSTNYLHNCFGTKVMNRYLREKSMADGSQQEKQKVYDDYITRYCTNPAKMGKVNSRQYIQRRATETKSYAIYKDMYAHNEYWTQSVLSSVGKFFYGIMLREVKFDIQALKDNNSCTINKENLVNAFYTAYFQVDRGYKIKEEFRSHHDFEKLYEKASITRLKFDYTFLPTLTPPMPWLSPEVGGYLTNKSDFIRLSTFYGDQKTNTFKDVKNQKLYPSFDSLNAVGLCPWIVNQEVLDIVIAIFKSGGNLELNVPLDKSKMKSSAPVLIENGSKADRILYNKEKAKFDQKMKEMYSLWRDCLYRLSIANHFRDKTFWFPHNLDFRGRSYPIPPHFNHLGSDLARSLLLFAKGQPLGEKGLDWLKLHLINLVGNMKSASHKERLDYANSILHLEVLDSADNPMDGRRWWTKSEHRWQVLACCKEIAKVIRSGDVINYVSHFPIHQDGSCNGLQHYAALGRDPGGAKAVNLVPSDRPQDVYSKVVDIVENMRKADAKNGDKKAEMLEGFIKRKVVKQTIMTTVYGVTRYGARQQIARQLTARGYSDNEVWAASTYLASKTFDSIGNLFEKSRLIQDWLNQCAYIIASKFKQPVKWYTPLGLQVCQPYTMPNNHSWNRLLSNTLGSKAMIMNNQISRLNAPKQKTAFPPNFIHSLDSCHMMLTSLYCQRAGITFVSVHDCYWTHPSTVDIMNRICREQFVALHSQPLLHDLSQQFVDQFKNECHDRPKSDSSSTDRSPFAIGNYYIDNAMEAEVVEDESIDSGYDDHLVDDDLVDLIGHDEAKAFLNANTNTDVLENKSELSIKTMSEDYKDSRKESLASNLRVFKNVPKQGDLDLKVVLNSAYFFS